MTSSTVGLIFLILYFLYLDGSNWRNLIKLGLISTLEFQTNQCLCSHFWALVVDQYCRAKITLWTSQTIYNIRMKENLSTSWATSILICGGTLCSSISWSNSNGVECSVSRVVVTSTDGDSNTTIQTYIPFKSVASGKVVAGMAPYDPTQHTGPDSVL